MSEEWVDKQLQLFNFDFDQADRNKNGTLSFSELLTILRAQGYNGTYDEAQPIFKHLDRDGNRAISRQEFSDSIKAMPKMTLREFALRKIFKSLDMDGSGYLTKDEIDKAIKHNLVGMDLSKEITDHVLQAVAKDDDQKLNYEEYLCAFKLETEALEMRLLFKKLDTDNSGQLTRGEILESIKSDFELNLVQDKITNLITNLYKDDDEKFSYEEFIKVWQEGKGQ